ncbi:MAG: Gfo/Idh/MocA family protein [Planctomycetota bacterium]
MSHHCASSANSRSATRRDFLKTSSAMAMVTGIGLARSAHAAGSDEIRIALVGCGGRGTGAAVNALNAQPNVKLVALADAFPERVERAQKSLLTRFDKQRVAVSEDHKFVGLDAYDKALAADVHLVLLCTPPGFRPTQFQAAVDAGKHVFMEKPLAVDAPGYRKIRAANEVAKQKGLLVAVGHHLRHEKKHTEVIQQIHDGAIGDIHFMRAYFNTGRIWVRPRRPEQTELQYQVNNWYHFTWLSGDHITEQHVHDLDVCNWMVNDHPVEAQSLAGRQRRDDEDYGEIFDHHAVEFTYASGVKLFSYCRQIGGCWGSFSEHAHGANGTVNIQGHGSSTITRRGQEPVVRERGRDGHQVEHDHLFQALLAGRPYNEVDMTVDSTMTAILGRMASYSGKIVTWDDAIHSELDLAPDELAWNATPPVQPLSNNTYAIPMPGVTEAL